MTYEEKNKLIQELMREFDIEFFKRKIESGGSRFIEVDGKIMSEMEFVQHKLNQVNDKTK